MTKNKFRAWGKHSLEFFVPAGVGSYGFTLEDLSNGCLYDIDAWVVEQCTGMEDKNGREIYEGDIVKVSDSYGTRPAVVAYGEAEFVVDLGVATAFLSWYKGEIEVVGNIHETPELLGEAR